VNKQYILIKSAAVSWH